MLDPFRLAGKLFVAAFRITGYTCAFLMQCCVYVVYRQPEKVGDALGDLGRATTDALADIFRAH
jgi:hypothetical protein